MAPASASFRFRPRLRAFPWLVAAVGLGLLAAGPLGDLRGASRTFALVCGALGPLIAAAYLASPAWRLRVEVDDEALTVLRKDDVRFRLPWSEVRQVVASPSTRTCFVDGGHPSRSLLVPGPGAPGPYRIERREALYDFIVAHVPPAKLREVPDLESLRGRS